MTRIRFEPQDKHIALVAQTHQVNESSSVVPNGFVSLTRRIRLGRLAACNLFCLPRGEWFCLYMVYPVYPIDAGCGQDHNG